MSLPASSTVSDRLQHPGWRGWRHSLLVQASRLAWYALFLALLSGSTLQVKGSIWPFRAFTRGLEFNYISWSIDAMGEKLLYASLGAQRYLTGEQRRSLVSEYLEVLSQVRVREAALGDIFADPAVTDKVTASAELRRELTDLRVRLKHLEPLAEEIVQTQLSTTLSNLGLTLAGQPMPPVLYAATPLPLALIISPREVIRQEHDISLLGDLPLEQWVALEDKIATALNVSTYITQIGGVGLYPTMVFQTTDLTWLAEVVAHEWVHNFLTLRPLGASYLNTPELRVINETTASIAGKEIGQALIEAYYPELLPQPALETQPSPTPQASEPAAPVFDYYQEMRITRVTADELLAQGKIDEAEAYMEQRRVFLWENGYRLRKLNQAYFAFHGAYADHPSGGAAGADPVGAAVRELRARSASVHEFLERISWIYSWEQLQAMVR